MAECTEAERAFLDACHDRDADRSGRTGRSEAEYQASLGMLQERLSAEIPGWRETLCTLAREANRINEKYSAIYRQVRRAGLNPDEILRSEGIDS